MSFKVLGENQSSIPFTLKSVSESLAYLEFEKPLVKGTYQVKLTVGGNNYEKEFSVSQGAEEVNRWEAPAVISKNAERHDFYYYTENIISNDKLVAKIPGYSGEIAVYASEWIRENGAKGTCIQVWIPTRKLAIGNHSVQITGDGNLAVSRDFEVIDSDYDKFVLDTYSLSWIDDNTIQVYIKTPNCGENDEYDIKLTGENDREAADTTAVVTDRYTDSLFMNITGLNRNSAFKNYYVLVTHKKIWPAL